MIIAARIRFMTYTDYARALEEFSTESIDFEINVNPEYKYDVRVLHVDDARWEQTLDRLQNADINFKIMHALKS